MGPIDNMAKEKKGSGIQQAAGLIRYFDEESEDAIQISRGMIYFACIAFSVTIYLANHGCLLYTSPSPRDRQKSRMPSSA